MKRLIILSVTWANVVMGGVADEPPRLQTRLPQLTDEINYTLVIDGELLCTYQDTVPFVKSVNLDHHLIQLAKPQMLKVFRSTMTYREWNAPYHLNKETWTRYKKEYRTATPARQAEINARVAEAHFENFMTVLCGEYRDYPEMIEKKLKVIAYNMPVGPRRNSELSRSDSKFLIPENGTIWWTLSGEGYRRLNDIMATLYKYLLDIVDPAPERFNYAWGEKGHMCNRRDHSVRPLSECEMAYLFANYLTVPDEQYDFDPETLVAEFKDSCPEPPKYYYNFRGHKNFKPLWLESNAFIWISLLMGDRVNVQVRAGETVDPSYYQRPFASRYAIAKGVWAAYIMYPEDHHQYMRKASETGGGPHLYISMLSRKSGVTNLGDENQDGLSDYILFPNVEGDGDIGLKSQALDIDVVLGKDHGGKQTIDTMQLKNGKLAMVSGLTQPLLQGLDWGFMSVFPDFESRMARLNVGLDRHTNWGPTHMVNAVLYRDYGRKRNTIRGAYSPIVACSYMIDASNAFASGDYPSTHPDEMGRTKWMFIQKLPAAYYYDEKDLRAGRPINWNTHFFNETSLSNDYYTERALDRFGWIPPEAIEANLYLVTATSP